MGPNSEYACVNFLRINILTSLIPANFLFQLTQGEKAEVVANCDHLRNLKFSKAQPFAFTEHGAIRAANVLASSQAVEMGIYVVRAFYVAATRATQRALMRAGEAGGFGRRLLE